MERLLPRRDRLEEYVKDRITHSETVKEQKFWQRMLKAMKEKKQGSKA